jgi:hypothetical protein
VSYSAADLREMEQCAAQMYEAAAQSEREHQAQADTSTGQQSYIAQALAQIQGCHKRHFKRIAEAYALTAHEIER